ncbi:LysR substrate-binding domain-containing protein [Massilia sp. W12]|uniref:LysR family transcriptional regulator n=1 Tax=Massilia sp. W12 TaxID=3126507 RepID=UPI0030D0B435
MDPLLRKLDLNLLKVFDLLYDTGSVSDTANLLCISQSAASHSLRRLRLVLDDPLFVNSRQGMSPTKLAQQLMPGIRQALATLQHSLNFDHDFQPAASRRCFTLYASEYVELLLLPPLLTLLRQQAPHCSLEVRRLQNRIPAAELEQGSADLAISYAGCFELHPNLCQEALLQEELCCVLDAADALAADQLDLPAYLALPHIYPAPWGDSSNLVDAWLARQGQQRCIRLSTQNYLAAALALPGSGALLTMPRRLAQAMGAWLPLRILPAPPGLPGFTLEILSARQFHASAPNRWLRACLQQVAASL